MATTAHGLWAFVFQCVVALSAIQCCLVTLCSAQDVEWAKSRSLDVERELQQIVSDTSVPAMWAGKFFVEDFVPSEKSYYAATGVRKVGEAMPVSRGDKLHLGSCTKAMTAILVAQTISSGELTFDTTLGEIFSDNPTVGESDWHSVTVKELLEHQSGAPANAPWDRIHSNSKKDVIAGRRAVLNWFCAQKMPSKRKFLYSNVGYCLLGHIVEQIRGASWEELIRKEVFLPLDMKNVGFGPILDDAAIKKTPLSQPWGHTEANMKSVLNSIGGLLGGKSAPSYSPVQFDNPVPLGPAGRCFMPMPEWAKFVAAVANQKAISGSPDPRLKISKAVWRELFSSDNKMDPQSKYAAGWIHLSRPWADGITYMHNGSNTTWYCVAWVAPKKDFFVLVATTAFNSSAISACDKIAAELVTKNESQ